MKSSELVQDAINRARREKTRRRNKTEEVEGKNPAGKLTDTAKAMIIIVGVFAFSIFLTTYKKMRVSSHGSKPKSQKNNIKYQANIKNKNTYKIEKSEKVTYRKKEIIKYIVYLKNGRKISCKNIPDIENGMIVITENRITTKIPASELVKIEGVWH